MHGATMKDMNTQVHEWMTWLWVWLIIARNKTKGNNIAQELFKKTPLNHVLLTWCYVLLTWDVDLAPLCKLSDEKSWNGSLCQCAGSGRDALGSCSLGSKNQLVGLRWTTSLQPHRSRIQCITTEVSTLKLNFISYGTELCTHTKTRNAGSFVVRSGDILLHLIEFKGFDVPNIPWIASIDWHHERITARTWRNYDPFLCDQCKLMASWTCAQPKERLTKHSKRWSMADRRSDSHLHVTEGSNSWPVTRRMRPSRPHAEHLILVECSEKFQLSRWPEMFWFVKSFCCRC